MEIELTKEEGEVIKSLKRVAKKWPKSLWLYSASGSLFVMKKRDGEVVMTDCGGVDPDYIVEQIDIENDGGDW